MEQPYMKTPNCLYIAEVTSENSGGGTFVDFVHLNDGRVIGITDDCVCLYESLDAFWECRLENIPTIYLTPDIPPK
jgi:hypothetical protein